MHAIKLELQLKIQERTLMARHSSDASFCCHLVLVLDRAVKGFQVSSSKKVAAIESFVTNCVEKLPKYRWTKTRESGVEKMTFRHFGEVLSKLLKVLGGETKLTIKKDSDSFTLEDVGRNRAIFLEDYQPIKIKRLETFKLKETISFNSSVRAIFSISIATDKWYVSRAIEVETVRPLLHPVAQYAGIDLGAANFFATLSDGSLYESPLPLAKVKTKLSKKQWRNRNKQRGNQRLGVKASKNAPKHYSWLAELNAKTATGRREFLQKTATEISKRYARIRRGDLQAGGTIADRALAAAISDCEFSDGRCKLVYKSSMYGKTVELVDRWYLSSKTCSNCDRVRSMPLKEREFECQHGGAIMNRDIQVAIDLARHEKARKAGQGRSVKPADKKEPALLLAKSSSRTLNLLGVDLSKFHATANSSRPGNNY